MTQGLGQPSTTLRYMCACYVGVMFRGIRCFGACSFGLSTNLLSLLLRCIEMYQSGDVTTCAHLEDLLDGCQELGGRRRLAAGREQARVVHRRGTPAAGNRVRQTLNHRDPRFSSSFKIGRPTGTAYRFCYLHSGNKQARLSAYNMCGRKQREGRAR